MVSSRTSHFWYPQIKDSTAGSSPVSQALKQFCKLFDAAPAIADEPLHSAGASDSFNLKELQEKLKKLPDKSAPVCVLGTCSPKKAVEESWDQLGLNLFDLPWDTQPKAFAYLQVTALFQDLDALKKLLGIDAGPDVAEEPEKAQEQLKWARYHRFALATQKAVGHGERGRMQGRGPKGVVEELFQSARQFRDIFDSGKTSLPVKIYDILHDIAVHLTEIKLGERIEDSDKSTWLKDALENYNAGGGRESPLNNLVHVLPDSLTELADKKEEWLEQARRVANLDCRAYKLASAIYQGEDAPEGRIKYAVVVEDDPKFREAFLPDLARILLTDSEELEAENYRACNLKKPAPDQPGLRIFRRQNGDHNSFLFIEVADHIASRDQLSLYDAAKDDILDRLFERGIVLIHQMPEKEGEGGEEGWIKQLREQRAKLLSHEVLLCFDLELDKGVQQDWARVYRGHWLMYTTVRQYPYVPRLVITGFRSQDLLGFTAGSAAYLTKPYTLKRLRQQIEQARQLYSVHWLCPKEVQANYASALAGLTFEKCYTMLNTWLKEHSIDLKVRSRGAADGAWAQVSKDRLRDVDIAESDLIVLDLLEIPAPGKRPDNLKRSFDALLNQITQIRRVNIRVPLLVVLPMGLEADEVFARCYRDLPLRLRDGGDAILKKPTWFIAEGHSESHAGFGNLIVEQLGLGLLNVKYQVLVPVAAVIGRFDDVFVQKVNRRDYGERPDRWDRFYAPLLPALVPVFGLAGPVKELADPSYQFRLRDTLYKYVRQMKGAEPGRWKTAAPGDIREAIDAAVEFIQHELVNHHATLEAWLRDAVDYWAAQRGGAKNLNSFIEPLARVFGGATRYEFTVNGIWYPGGSPPVNDMLIVIEFGAKSSLAARAFIETTVVKYLSRIAGEQLVMVQEIPIRGYFHS